MKRIFIVFSIDRAFLIHRKDIALTAKKKGYDVSIVAADTGKKDEILSLGLNFINLPISRSGKNIFQDMKSFFFLMNLYRLERPDIVHHVGIKILLWGGLAAKITKINGVVNAVSGLGTLFSQEKKTLISSLFIKIFRFSNKRKNLFIIFQNNEDKSFFLNQKVVRPEQIQMTNGSGVDLDKYTYSTEIKNGKIKIIFTARMIIEKGVIILINAAEILRQKYQDKIQFLLCGNIDDSSQAIRKEELESLCDGEYIQWLDFRTDIPLLLKESHIVVFPSYYREGIPKALIEAAAIGRPIITTDYVGCKEAVIDNYNGYLVPIKDSNAIAEKIEILIQDENKRIEMGQNSRNLAESKFSIVDVINKHMEIYQLLLNIKNT